MSSVILSSFTAQAKIPRQVSDSGYIINYYKLNEEIATSGSINKQGIQWLSDNKFKTIIDLRTPKEGTKLELKAVQKLKMAYINIPIEGGYISEEQVSHFKETLQRSQRPILIHCASGNRVGALWAKYLLSKDVPKEEALKVGRKIGMSMYLEQKIDSEFP